MTIILCSLCYIFIIIYSYYSKKRIKSVETKIYSLMIVFSVLCLLFETLSIVFIGDYQKFYLESLIFNKLFILCILYWTSLLTIYIYHISFINDNKKNIVIKNFSEKITTIFWLFVAVFSILIFILPLYFHNDNNTVYSYGPATDIVSVIVAIYIIVWLFCIFKNFKYLKNKKYLPILIFIICVIITLIVRTINPEILLINATISLVTVLMYHTIENPDLRMLNEMELAKDMAEKANFAKSDFLSSMSHEIRTPLNAIKAFSEFNITTTDINEANENAREAVKAIEILLELINGVLDISKIESGSMEIVNVDYDPKTLFNDISKLINVRIKDKNLDFKINIAQDIPSILYGDKSRIQQVLMNLLTNAVKYTSEGSVSFNVQCVNNNSICSLIIAVEDTGRGIKPESINKLFTKFNRLEEDRNTTTEGTGLGLAITKQLIQMMDGKITVQSVYESGSKFTVKLNQQIKDSHPNKTPTFEPDKKIELEIPVKKEMEPVINTVPTNFIYNYGDKKVLVVDDNETNLKVMTKFLRDYNIIPVECLTAFEVINRINNGEKYDLLLIDDMMPKMSGCELLEKLKKVGYLSSMVVLTANAKIGDKERYLNLGFDDYIGKPIDRAELERVLTKYLESKPKDNDLKFLKEKGADIDKALELLGDISMYNETMEIFYKNIFDKAKLIEEAKNKNDLKNYAILVHGIKSDLKYLGFNDIANIFYEHEIASKENNLEYVNNNYNQIVNEINKISNISQEYLEKNKII